jgi:hypothetical protein
LPEAGQMKPHLSHVLHPINDCGFRLKPTFVVNSTSALGRR